MLSREQMTDLIDWVEARIDLEIAGLTQREMRMWAEDERTARAAMWKSLTGKGEHQQ